MTTPEHAADVEAMLAAHAAKCSGAYGGDKKECGPLYCPPCSEAITEWVKWTPVHLAAALAPVIAAAEARAWPCDNYRSPVTCLTAPSSETGRCDFCRTQGSTAEAQALWDAAGRLDSLLRKAARHLDREKDYSPASGDWLRAEADRIRAQR